MIYNPITDELFVAERGKGAFLNDKRLRVAARKRLADSVIACGLPHLGRGDLDLGLRELGAVQDKVAGLRRFGAAALDLAFVAAGRLDGYWERNISPWDIAAGIILVREAGGFVTDIDGERRHVHQDAYRCRQRDDPPRIADSAESRQLGRWRPESDAAPSGFAAICVESAVTCVTFARPVP